LIEVLGNPKLNAKKNLEEISDMKSAERKFLDN
jgi:hypothetical protein